MLKIVGTESAQDEVERRSLLEEVAREGGRRMLVAALETEVAAARGTASRAESPSSRASATRARRTRGRSSASRTTALVRPSLRCASLRW